MSCEICGRSACARSFHSLAAQEEFDKMKSDGIEICNQCGGIGGDHASGCGGNPIVANSPVNDTHKPVTCPTCGKTMPWPGVHTCAVKAEARTPNPRTQHAYWEDQSRGELVVELCQLEQVNDRHIRELAAVTAEREALLNRQRKLVEGIENFYAKHSAFALATLNFSQGTMTAEEHSRTAKECDDALAELMVLKENAK